MTADLPPIQRRAAGGEITPSEGVSIAAFGGGDAVPTAEGKRGQDTKHGFLSPLDSPDLPLSRRIEDARLNGGVRELGSVRRADFWTLYCPEFSLRKAPRITVRGHSVQGVCTVAAKSSASIKDCTLEHQTPLWAPRF